MRAKAAPLAGLPLMRSCNSIYRQSRKATHRAEGASPEQSEGKRERAKTERTQLPLERAILFTKEGDHIALLPLEPSEDGAKEQL